MLFRKHLVYLGRKKETQERKCFLNSKRIVRANRYNQYIRIIAQVRSPSKGLHRDSMIRPRFPSVQVLLKMVIVR